jgi:hypothetical protein
MNANPTSLPASAPASTPAPTENVPPPPIQVSSALQGDRVLFSLVQGEVRAAVLLTAEEAMSVAVQMIRTARAAAAFREPVGLTVSAEVPRPTEPETPPACPTT